MINDDAIRNKNQGLVLIVVAIFVFFAALLLSRGWTQGYSLIQNLNRIYIIRFGEGFRDYYHIYTKYVLVAALALGSYGILIFTGALISPFDRIAAIYRRALAGIRRMYFEE